MQQIIIMTQLKKIGVSRSSRMELLKIMTVFGILLYPTQSLALVIMPSINAPH